MGSPIAGNCGEVRPRLAVRDLVLEGRPGRAVRDVALEVGRGEIPAIVGPSGSGKSSLLRLLAGLESPDAGKVLLNEREVTFLPPQARGFGVVFQESTLFRRLTVKENVAFGLRARRQSRKEISQQVESVLSRFDLEAVRDALPCSLSGGQERKVALARALIWEPRAVLLDEPFKAMDAVSRLRIRQVVRSMVKQFGAPTLLITHDQEEALEIGDRVAVLNEGRVEQVGSPFDLYLHPANEFVATFFGAANVMLGFWSAGAVRIGGLTLEAPPDCLGFEDRQPVKIVCRPEDLVVNFSSQLLESAHFLGEGLVEEVFYVGAGERLIVRLRSPDSLSVGQSSASSTYRPMLVDGNNFPLTVPLTVVRSKRDAEEMGVSAGDSVVVGLRSFRVLPHYPLASEG